jgi:hypothetical protein
MITVLYVFMKWCTRSMQYLNRIFNKCRFHSEEIERVELKYIILASP